MTLMKGRGARLALALATALLASSAFSAALQAQEPGRIVGRVTSAATAGPLEGAQVVVLGPEVGALSDGAGNFLIRSVPAGAYTVRVRLLGYAAAEKRVTVVAGQPLEVNFSLAQTAVALEEIVVTGTAAEVRAREVGNALDALTSRDIQNMPVTNPEDILGGRIPGVTVVQAAGQPGAGGTIRIRGQTTASQAPEPLIYIDGVRVNNLPIGGGSSSRVSFSPLQDINAADIERVEVVKGASATTLYGTEAAGGVIQIFTKRGVAGSPIWNAQVTTGLSTMPALGADGDPTEFFTRCDADLFGLSQDGATLGQRVPFVDVTCPSSGRWFRTGLQQRHALSVRGGSDAVTYFVSGSYNDAQGTLDTQSSRDGGIRANLDIRPREDLSVAVNTAYTRRASRFVEDGNNGNGFLLNVGRGTNSNFQGGKGDDCAAVPSDVVCVSNAYLLSDTESTATSDRYTLGSVIGWSPAEGLPQRLAIGWDYQSITAEDWEFFGHLRTPRGSFSSNLDTREKLSIDYTGSWNASTGGGALSSTFSWGGQIFRDQLRQKFVSTRDFTGPGRPLLTSGSASPFIDDQSIAVTNAGFFLQETLGHRDRLFLTLGLRVDGNSAFGDDFGLQSYPKASVSWILSDYDFWPGELVDAFKLRGAVGYSGKAPGVFDQLRTWVPVTEEAGSGGFTPGDVGNVGLGPERTREYEVGFDASFLRGRLGLEATYYDTRTADALVPVTLPPSQGFIATSVQNVGVLEGRGAEFQLTADLVRSSTFDWSVRANLGFNRTEAVELDGQEIFADNKAAVREGFPVPSYFGTRVMNPDELADPIIEADQYYGPVNPTRIIGLQSTFTLYESLTADVLVEHQGGHFLPNYTGYQNGRRGVWFPCFQVQEALLDQFNGDPGPVSRLTASQRAR